MFTGWLHVVHTGGFTTVCLGFLLLFAVSFVPVIPIPVILAVMGAVLPLWSSILIAWTAVVTGAIAKFLLERWLLQRHVQRYLSRYRHWNTVLAVVDKHGFLAVIITRLIPFMPSAAVNLASAVTRLPFPIFFIATVLGLLPGVVAFSLAGHQFRHHGLTGVLIAGGYIIVMGIVAWKIRAEIRSDRT